MLKKKKKTLKKGTFLVKYPIAQALLKKLHLNMELG